MKKPFITLSVNSNILSSIERIKRLNGEFNLIAELYTNLLPEITIKNLRKVTINLIEGKGDKYISYYDKLIPVCVIETPFNFDFYERLNDEEKKKISLETIATSIREAAEKFNWDIAPFETAYQKVIERNYQNIILSKDQKPSQDKNLYATIEVEMEFALTYLRLVFFDKEGKVLKKVVLYEMESSSFWWGHYVAGLKWGWINEDEILVTDRHKEVNFNVSYSKQIAELYYTPHKHPEEFIRNEMEILKYGKSSEELNKLINKRTQHLMVRVGGYFG